MNPDEEIRDYEKPIFDGPCGWSANTRHGLVWWVFQDERQHNPDLYYEALEVVKEVIRTGNPPFGGWI